MNRNNQTIIIEKLRNKIKNKDLWIWGAGNQGRGIGQTLAKYNISPVGFIDSSSVLIGRTALGLPVYSFSTVRNFNSDSQPPFIIVASFFHEREIASECQAAGLVEGLDFISYTTLKPRDYVIEVSGSCNLRCIACPRANRNGPHPSGRMRLPIFRKTLDKILREDPFVGNVQLYQWGEPLLNPELPQIIQYANDKGIKSALSSNLNLKIDYASVIQAKPEWFRISISGWGENYERTHTGGKWNVFLSNMKKLADLRKIYHPTMKVEVYFHLYRHNLGDLERVKRLCLDLDFEFHPVYAYLISLDEVMDHLEGQPLSPQAEEAYNLLLLDTQQGLSLARKERELSCPSLRGIYIKSDLSVANCMMFYYEKDNLSVTNFLETPLSKIIKARTDMALCKRCAKHALHRYCSVYATASIDHNMLAIS